MCENTGDLAGAVRQMEKRLGKERIRKTMISAIKAQGGHAYSAVFEYGTVVCVYADEVGVPNAEAIAARAQRGLDATELWQVFPAEGDDEVAPDEVKVFYSMNEPDGWVNYYSVIDDKLYEWLLQNNMTAEDVCEYFHSRDVENRRVCLVLPPDGAAL